MPLEINDIVSDGNAVLLAPPAASQLLAKFGVRAAIPTLAKLRCVGGGPVFRRFGRRIVYERQELIQWVEKRLSKRLNSTSEANEARHG